MNHVTHVNESCHTYGWVTLRVRTYIYEWVMSHIWMRHVTCANVHEWTSQVTHMDESCHTYERVTSHAHIWMSHVLCANVHLLATLLATSADEHATKRVPWKPRKKKKETNYIYIHANTNTYIFVYMYTWDDVCIFIHIYIHMHMHT